jgi:hypothetical protein
MKRKIKSKIYQNIVMTALATALFLCGCGTPEKNETLTADNYKVLPRWAKDSVAVFNSELMPIMEKSSITGYIKGSDTVNCVGQAYKSYIIVMKDGRRGYVDRSLTIRINASGGLLKSISLLHWGGKNIKFWLIYILFGSCLLYFILSLTALRYLRWFNAFTNLFLFISLGSIILFGTLAAKSYINFWIFDIVFPGRKTFYRYFLTVVNMFAMLFCFFAIRRGISMKGSFWSAKTGGESFVEIIYMVSMIAPVAAFFFRFFSGRLSFDSFPEYLSFQFASMWYGNGFWAFLMGWTTFLYMLLIAGYTVYLLLKSSLHPGAWLWAAVLPFASVLVFLCIYFSLLKLEDVIMTTLVPTAIMIAGIFHSGRNPVQWVHTHDIQNSYGQTVGRGYTAKPNVNKSHRPDRIDPL